MSAPQPPVCASPSKRPPVEPSARMAGRDDTVAGRQHGCRARGDVPLRARTLTAEAMSV